MTAESPDNTRDLQGQAELFAARRSGRALAAVSMVEDEESAKRFGAGRPPGSKNKSTAARLALVQRIAGDPLLQSARILAMSLEELAGWLGCSRTAAAAFQQAERALILPYVASKAAQEIKLTNPPVPLHLHMASGAAPAPGARVAGAVSMFQAEALRLGHTAEPMEGVFEEEQPDQAKSGT